MKISCLAGSLFFFGFALFWQVPFIQAADVEVIGDLQASQCPDYAWIEQEGIPIFDPLASPDSTRDQKDLEDRDREVRIEVEKELGKKRWTPSSGSPACYLRYSLIEELDLGISSRDQGMSPPRSTDGLGSAPPAQGGSSHLRKHGIFTLDVLIGAPPRQVWRGSLEGSTGQGKAAQKSARKLAREVAKALPSR